MDNNNTNAVESQEIRQVAEIKRIEVKGIFDVITQSPWRIISWYGARRGDLYLRFPPRDPWTNGTLVRRGDQFRLGRDLLPVQRPDGTLDERAFIGGCGVIVDAYGKEYNVTDKLAERRRGEKVIIEPAGTLRWGQVKQWDHDNPRPTKHWQPKGEGLNYDPLAHDLYLLQGMYNDSVKTQPNGSLMLGRYGQWRAFCQVCMRGAMIIRALGVEWRVTDPPQTTPIEYPSDEIKKWARQPLTGFRGDNLVTTVLERSRRTTTRVH